MNKYKVEFGEDGIFIETNYVLVKVYEDNGRFEFPYPSMEFDSIEKAVEAMNIVATTLPLGQHYRIFKKKYEMVG